MDGLEKEKILYKEIGILIDRFSREYNISTTQVLGVLELLKTDVTDQYKHRES